MGGKRTRKALLVDVRGLHRLHRFIANITLAQAIADHCKGTIIGRTSVNGALSPLVRMVRQRFSSSSRSAGADANTMLSTPLDRTLELQRFGLCAYAHA